MCAHLEVTRGYDTRRSHQTPTSARRKTSCPNNGAAVKTNVPEQKVMEVFFVFSFVSGGEYWNQRASHPGPEQTGATAASETRGITSAQPECDSDDTDIPSSAAKGRVFELLQPKKQLPAFSIQHQKQSPRTPEPERALNNHGDRPPWLKPPPTKTLQPKDELDVRLSCARRRQEI